MKNNSSLSKRMKRYERVSDTYLMTRTPVIIRMDGIAFHTFCEGLDKPYDIPFRDIMNSTMKYMCENVPGCVFGYTQSDEITIILVDYTSFNTESWFDYNVEKLVSNSAAMCSVAFNMFLYEMCGTQKYFDKLFKARFDSRAFNVPIHDVTNNIIWRQEDAINNSLCLLAQSHYTDEELHLMNRSCVHEMLYQKGINWNDVPTHLKRGAACYKKDEIHHNATNVEDIIKSGITDNRVIKERWFIDLEMPIITKDRDYIEKLLCQDCL